MPLSPDHIENMLENSGFADNQAGVARAQWRTLLFWLALAGLLVAAVLTRLYHLDTPFDRDGYDEGVYWQSLRAMLAGNSLYHTIFYSQPPAFLLSIYPAFAAFGGTLWSARFSIALVSLLSVPGALLIGKTLAGRVGMLVALLLLVVNPILLAESQIIQAEAPSVAFTFLAMGFALLWWQKPSGWRGALWAALTGIALVISILCKLLCASTLVPIALFMGARIWQIWRKQPGTQGRSWFPLLSGVAFALLTVVAFVLPFAGSSSAFWQSVVTFHQVASRVQPGTLRGNLHLMEPTLFSLLALAAAYGSGAALLRKDWRVLPLLAWLLATSALLLLQHPLFSHHLITLEPPLIALAILGVAKSDESSDANADGQQRRYTNKFIGQAMNQPRYTEERQFTGRGQADAPTMDEARLAMKDASVLATHTKREKDARYGASRMIPALALLLILFTSDLNIWQDVQHFSAINATSTSASVQQDQHVASDLRQAIAPDQWVITDGQFIAGLAERSTPPALVDTSAVRISSGYITLTQLEQAASDPRVHAILFYTGRFSLPSVSSFHAWVAQHFHLLATYGPGQELWVR